MPVTGATFQQRFAELQKEIEKIQEYGEATGIAIKGALSFGTGAGANRFAQYMPILYAMNAGIDRAVQEWIDHNSAQAVDQAVRELDREMHSDNAFMQQGNRSVVIAGTLPVGTEIVRTSYMGHGGRRQERVFSSRVKSIVPLWDALKLPPQPWTFRTLADYRGQIAVGVPTTQYQWEQIKRERIYGTRREQAADAPILRHALSDPAIILRRQRLGLPT